jgi:membrane protease YdiL (CAAX protease family)
MTKEKISISILLILGGFALYAVLLGVQSSGFFSFMGDAIPLLWFIFSNAVMEELWFRGVFLRNYKNLVGRKAAILVTSIVFDVPISMLNMSFQEEDGCLA